MGRIVISTNVTLDGVSQDPTGHEGFAFGGWFETMSTVEREAWAKVELEEALAAEAMLLGGTSYEWFASRWAGRDGVWGERLQNLPKYVVRTSTGRLDWGPTRVVRGDLPAEIAAEIAAIKDSVDGDIVVYASYQLVQLLVENDLVDEVRLFVFPQVLGSGGRVFGELSASKPLRLVAANRVGDTLLHLTYAF